MASVKELVVDTGVESLHKVADTASGKYLCYTRLSKLDDVEEWILGVSDGYEVWLLKLDMEELDNCREVADVSNLDAYLSRFRTSFLAGDIQVTQIGVKVTLTVGRGAKTLTFDLFEAKALEKKTELQSVLFRLAETATVLESKLTEANHTIATLKQQKGGAGAASVTLFDLDPKSKKGQPKAPPKKAGMSVINPGSKKRKAAQGVVFE